MTRARTHVVSLAALALLGGAACASLANPFAAETGTPPALHGSPPANLPAPEGLRASSGELRSVPLKWDPLLSGDVGGYAVERSLEREGPFTRVAIAQGRLNTVTVDRTPLEPETPDGKNAATLLGDGVTVFYRVRAYTPTGQLSENGSEVVAATTSPLPAVPEDLRAYSHQPRQVPLSWRASEDPNVTGYVVGRSPTYRGPFEQLARVEGRYESVYVDTGLGDLRVFYYRVSAFNSVGATGPASEPVRAVTKPVPLPPIGLAVVEKRLSANRLEWKPNVETDLVEYRLLRTREGSDTPERVRHLPTRALEALEVVDSELEADERVSYVLIALDRDELESAASEPIEVESEGYGLSATARGDRVHLAWRPRSDEGYVGARVKRRGMLRDVVLGFATDGRFIDTDVKPGGSYRYLVVLEDANGIPAPPSSPVEIHIPDS